MAITQTQQVTGNGATVTLNSVVSGALLTLQTGAFKSGAPGGSVSTPTDTQGTWSASSNPTLADEGPGNGVGAQIFHQANVASGTHTVTPDGTVGSHHHTLSEWANATSSPFDKNNSNTISNSDHTSNTVGSTGTLSQADELILIAHGMAAPGGAADVGYTDPVSTYTKQFLGTNDATDVATFHLYKTVNATTAEAPTFNWTSHEANMASQSVIATFKAAPVGPAINTQPSNQSVYETQTASFSISATTSGGTLHYQWKFNGSNVGSDQNSYDRTNCVVADDRGVVTCVVTDDNGSTTSNGAVLYVGYAPPIAWTKA